MRKKLLIVDDEALIREGLIARLSYLGFLFDDVLEAESGAAALKLVKQRGVDCVITDIQMPDMDGLTFIREAKAVSPRLRFLILSGYAEFAYAREALFLGVSAYLLKPLSNEELKHEMEKLLADMEQAAVIQEKIVSGSRLKKEKEEYAREKKVNAMLRLSLKEQKNDKHTGGGHFYRLAILAIDEKSCDRVFTKEDMELIRFTVKNVFGEVTAPHRLLLVNSLVNREQMYAVFKSTGMDMEGLRREVEQVFLQVHSILEKKMGIYLTAAVSGPGRALCKEMLLQAETALRQRLLYEDGCLYFFEDEKLFSEKQFPGMELYLLEQAAAEGEVEETGRVLDRLFSGEQMRRYGVSYVRILQLRVLNMLLKYYEPEIQQHMGVAALMRRFDMLDQMPGMEQIRSGLKAIVVECMDSHGAQDSNARDKILLAAEYIKSHYQENISVGSLAKRYHMSPNYFSTTFKKELDRSAVNYMTELRVEKAMEYLRDTADSVAEITEKVGYEDSQYFFRVFKKMTGITPLQYRQQCKQQQNKPEQNKPEQNKPEQNKPQSL